MSVLRSMDNDRVKSWARLASDPRERRRLSQALIEGPHLVETCLDRGAALASLIVSEAGLARREIVALVDRSGKPPVILSVRLFQKISDTESPAGIAAVIDVPQDSVDSASSPGCVFLQGIQDAGNVGAILRSAAAFAVPDVIVGRDCADPWSPKALRAGMGGHFFLRIASTSDLAGEVARFGETSLCTVVRDGVPIESVDLTQRIGWIFGSEGAGVAPELAAMAACRVSIATPGGAESLNVAAAAAIFFYERQRQIRRRAARS